MDELIELLLRMVIGAATNREKPRPNMTVPPPPPVPTSNVLRSLPLPPQSLKPTIQRSPAMREQLPKQVRRGMSPAQIIQKQLALAAQNLRKRPPSIPAGAKKVVPTITAPPSPITQVPRPVATTSTAASARTLKTWLQPATLRRQFIVTEIFQPPLAMREDHLK